MSTGSNDYAKGTCKLPVEYVYTESGTGKRYFGGYSIGGSYADGQDCCNQCYNNNKAVDWVAFVEPSASSQKACYCYTNSPSEPSIK